jgi:hypothetical protein
MTYRGLAVPVEEMTCEKEGAQLFKGALSIAQLSELERAIADEPRDPAGVRLSGIPELRSCLGPTGPVGHVAASTLGPECLPVRAILFDKNADQNWSLGWHQDHPALDAPRPETVYVDALPDCNGAVLQRATSGSMRRLFCMRRTPLASRCIAGFCRSITPSASFPAVWNGPVSEPCDYCPGASE